MKLSESKYVSQELRLFDEAVSTPEGRAFLEAIMAKEDPYGIWTAQENDFPRDLEQFEKYFHNARVYFDTRCPVCGHVTTFSCSDRPNTGMFVKRFHCKCGKTYMLGRHIIRDSGFLLNKNDITLIVTLIIIATIIIWACVYE